MSQTIEIQRGDTLSWLARRHNTTTAHLARTNGISNPDLIYAGDPLVVPGPPSAMTAAPVPQAPPPVPQSPQMPAAAAAPGPQAGPAQPPAPPANAPAAPAAAQDGAAAGEAAADGEEDTPPGEVVCNCDQDGGEKKEPAKIRAGGDENVDVFYAEAGGDAASEGALGRAEGQVGVGMTRMEHAGHFGDAPVGGSHTLENFTAAAEGEAGLVHGVGARGKAEARMVKQGASVFAGSDMNNPLAEVGGEYELMSAEAKGNILLGSDGKRAGVGGGFGLGAAAAKADAVGEFNIPIPFTDWTISGRGKGGVSAGALAVGGKAHALKNLETGRYHAGVGGKVAALLGLELDVDLSIGPGYSDRKRPDGP
jgi:hypothetical protein